jgi:hypothetical protein
MQERPIAYREIVFGGRKRIAVQRAVYVDELADAPGELGEYVATVKQVVARLAQVLGLVLERTTVREVVREVIKKVYVRRARKRIGTLEQQARAYARTRAGKGKRRGRPARTRGERTLQAVVNERWHSDEFVTAGAVDGGKTSEEW